MPGCGEESSQVRFLRAGEGAGSKCKGTGKEHVSVNPAVCHGRACIRGTRVLISVILDNIAAGVDRPEILAGYPSLRPEDIDAALAYAAELAREGAMDLPLELSA